MNQISNFVYGYDPRVCFIEDRYYVTWCNGYHGPTIGIIAYTYDFEKILSTGKRFSPIQQKWSNFSQKNKW